MSRAFAATGNAAASACVPASRACGRSAGSSAVSFDQWMEMDMQYIDTRNLLLDFKILARTVPAVLRRTGAY